MSVFDKDNITREYVIEDFYDIHVRGAAYGTIDENMRYIFGNKVNDYINEYKYIHKRINDIPVNDFKQLLDNFESQQHNSWARQRKLHRFLRRKLGVKHKCIKESHIITVYTPSTYQMLHGTILYRTDPSEGKISYYIYIPNGYCIEYATTDNICIEIEEK